MKITPNTIKTLTESAEVWMQQTFGKLDKKDNSFGFDVGMDTIALLNQNNKNGFLYRNLDTLAADGLESFDYLCTTGVSTCFVVCGYSEIFPHIRSIAHVSPINSIEDTLDDMSILINSYLNIEDAKIKFLIFGGLENDNKELQKSLENTNFNYTIESELNIKDVDNEDISIFICKDKIEAYFFKKGELSREKIYELNKNKKRNFDVSFLAEIAEKNLDSLKANSDNEELSTFPESVIKKTKKEN